MLDYVLDKIETLTCEIEYLTSNAKQTNTGFALLGLKQLEAGILTDLANDWIRHENL